MTTFIPTLTLPRAVFDHPASSILLPVSLGMAVGYLSSRSNQKQTYARVKNPPYSPPSFVFAPVWTVLYGVMGYAAYRAVSAGLSLSATSEQSDLARQGATLYTLQLALNLVWTPLFFVLRRPVEALVDIVALLGLNAYLAYTWGQVDRISGLLLLPYLGWLGFATYLCAGTGYLNGWDISDKAIEGEGKGKGKAKEQ
ncbi:benzodiazepine receptor family protein [Sodiomyces alkalinus F11]|uniref:Benzodiazepine receptor family protein n=1 Tax=Sodiomyces alkalinus (strain CBS 110278 / VKM F-3762 / F11) TaxID=1314773 RepID=A0A3N2PSH5_SODAK|nr:benzodiazepine receptor family protein [Sodiomyces alkalinus F11]ROT37457.1 benzodiazepine receptor family protein [Sodiomyces alkalinus F11]